MALNHGDGLKVCLKTVVLVLVVTFAKQCAGVEEVCPLGAITFNCTVTDATQALTTRWIGDSRVFDCPDEGNIIALIHDDSDPTFTLEPVPCGAATGQLQPQGGDVYTSVLTVVPTLEMSGSEFTVQCAFPRSDVIVMNYTASVIGPPRFAPDNLTVGEIKPVSEVLWEFNLEWNVSRDYCDLDMYVFTPLQPFNICTTNCPTECRRFRVGPDPLNFAVTAQNCEGVQNGPESEPLPVCFQRPGAPGNVFATATYDLDSNGVLSRLVLSWDEVIPKPVTAAREVPIWYYLISGVGADSIQVAPSVNCTDNRCSYEVAVPDDGSTEYNVSVAAMNVLGFGDATTVEQVFTSNTMYANVEANTTDDNCTLRIQCVSEDFNEFWITVTQSGTAVLTRRMIDCSASVPVVVEDQSMLPGEFAYEIEVMIGEDIKVILLGSFTGNCTEIEIITERDGGSSGGLSLGAIIGIIVVVIAGVLYFSGVVAAAGVAWYKRLAVSCLVIFLLIWLSWIYFIYLLCAGKKEHHSKGATQKSVETQMDDEEKSTEQVEMTDTYETVPSGQPAAVKTKVMGVESTPPQQTEAKSKEEPKAAKKKGFFKNRSGKKAAKKESDEVELQSQEPLESAETGAETGALYQDPGEIKREEYPGTHDFYAQPDIKRKTHKPEDHLPTYGDPRDIKHVEAPETGELYAVTKQPSKKRAAPPPPEGATGYTSVDIEKKHRAKELNYSELQMPPGGPAPPSQHVEYSNVVQL